MRNPIALFLLLTLATPAPGQAQAYRGSVLWPGPDSLAAASTAVADSATVDSALAGRVGVPPFHPPEVAQFNPTAGEPSYFLPVLGGILIGGLFTLGGTLLGNELDGETYDDISEGAILGYLVGETVGVPLGVHIGNKGRGNYAAGLGVSAVTHLGALGLAGIGSGAGYIIGVTGQVLLTTEVERATGRTRAKHAYEREQAAAAAEEPKKTP